MIKIYYSAYTCQGNIGDLLITKYQIEEYAKYAEIYVDCHGMPENFSKVIFNTQNPNLKNFEKEYGIYYRGKNIFKVLQILNKDGFTCFCSSPGPRVPLTLPLKSLVFKMFGMLIPRIVLNKCIKRYSLGVDIHFDKKGLLYLINRWYFGNFNVIGLRSEKNVYQYQDVLNNLSYIPDMAFLYPHFNEDNFKCNHNKIAISFREVDEYGILIEKLSDILSYFNTMGIPVDLLYQVEADKAFSERLMKDLCGYNLNFKKDLVDYCDLEVYANYDLIISNRLHVLLIGAMNGAIPYGLISHDKKENKIADIFSTVFNYTLYSYLEECSLKVVTSIFQKRSLLLNQIYKDIYSQRKHCEIFIAQLFK